MKTATPTQMRVEGNPLTEAKQTLAVADADVKTAQTVFDSANKAAREAEKVARHATLVTWLLKLVDTEGEVMDRAEAERETAQDAFNDLYLLKQMAAEDLKTAKTTQKDASEYFKRVNKELSELERAQETYVKAQATLAELVATINSEGGKHRAEVA